MDSNDEPKQQQQQPSPPPPPPPPPTSATDLYQICRLCLSTLNADEGESVFNNQVPSLPEKIYRVFGVSPVARARIINTGIVYGGFVNRRKILLTDNTGKYENVIMRWRRRPIMALRGFIIAATIFIISLSLPLSPTVCILVHRVNACSLILIIIIINNYIQLLL